MTEELPAPLTPAECDLRTFPYMPLDVVRLRDSDLAAIADAELFRCSVLAWCVAWHQVPAASLPDDDAAMARLLGLGRDVKGWKKLRAAGALRGFVKCSDGRLYHEVVAEKARAAWNAKSEQCDRTKKARAARLLQNGIIPVTDTVTDDVTGSNKRRITKQTEKARARPLAVVTADALAEQGSPMSAERAAELKDLLQKRGKYAEKIA